MAVSTGAFARLLLVLSYLASGAAASVCSGAASEVACSALPPGDSCFWYGQDNVCLTRCNAHSSSKSTCESYATQCEWALDNSGQLWRCTDRRTFCENYNEAACGASTGCQWIASSIGVTVTRRFPCYSKCDFGINTTSCYTGGDGVCFLYAGTCRLSCPVVEGATPPSALSYCDCPQQFTARYRTCVDRCNIFGTGACPSATCLSSGFGSCRANNCTMRTFAMCKDTPGCAAVAPSQDLFGGAACIPQCNAAAFNFQSTCEALADFCVWGVRINSFSPTCISRCRNHSTATCYSTVDCTRTWSNLRSEQCIPKCSASSVSSSQCLLYAPSEGTKCSYQGGTASCRDDCSAFHHLELAVPCPDHCGPTETFVDGPTGRTLKNCSSECKHLLSESVCLQWSCSWDTVARKCDKRCSTISVDVDCNATTHCNYDVETSRCLPLCFRHSGSSSAACSSVSRCTYSSSTSTCSDDCSSYTSLCPSARCFYTASFSSGNRCVQRCDGFSSESTCNALSACGWYLNRTEGTATCRPRCSNLRNVPSCPDYCLEVPDASGRCVERLANASQVLCELRPQYIWWEGECRMGCPATTQRDACLALPYCTFELVQEGMGMCLTRCGTGTPQQCGTAAYFNCTLLSPDNACVPRCNRHSVTWCPLSSCVPTDSSTTQPYACTTRCVNYNDNETACRQRPQCFYARQGQCAVSCSALYMVSTCNHPMTFATCTNTWPTCTVSCSTATTRDSCWALGGNCVWSNFHEYCTAEASAPCSSSSCSASFCDVRSASSSSIDCRLRCDSFSVEQCSSQAHCTLSSFYDAATQTAYQKCLGVCNLLSTSCSVDCARITVMSTATCQPRCLDAKTGADCDSQSGRCQWTTNGTCAPVCAFFTSSSFICTQMTHCEWRSGQCRARCGRLATLRACTLVGCAWDGVKCHDDCRTIDAAACNIDVASNRHCANATAENGTVICTHACSSMCTSSTLCRSQSSTCEVACSTHSAISCPVSAGCAVLFTANSRSGIPVNPWYRCADDCSHQTRQVSPDSCYRAGAECVWFGGNVSTPCRQPCEKYSRNKCPDYCSPSGLPNVNSCRPRCALITRMAECDDASLCVWDPNGASCRDSCGAVQYAGHSVSMCAQVLPYCKLVVGPRISECVPDCSLASKSQCGQSSQPFSRCVWLELNGTCVDHCPGYNNMCPTSACTIAAAALPSTEVCGAKCEVHNDELTCSKLRGACVWLRATGRCAVDCTSLRFASGNTAVPSHCVCVTGVTTTCANDIEALGMYSCQPQLWNGAECCTSGSQSCIPVFPLPWLVAPADAHSGLPFAAGFVVPDPPPQPRTESATFSADPTHSRSVTIPLPPTPVPIEGIVCTQPELLVSATVVLNGTSDVYATLIRQQNVTLRNRLTADLLSVFTAAQSGPCGVIDINVTSMTVGSLHVNFTALTQVNATAILSALNRSAVIMAAPFSGTRQLYGAANGGDQRSFSMNAAVIVSERSAVTPPPATEVPSVIDAVNGDSVVLSSTGAAIIIAGIFVLAVILVLVVIFVKVRRSRSDGSTEPYEKRTLKNETPPTVAREPVGEVETNPMRNVDEEADADGEADLTVAHGDEQVENDGTNDEEALTKGDDWVVEE